MPNEPAQQPALDYQSRNDFRVRRRLNLEWLKVFWTGFIAGGTVVAVIMSCAFFFIWRATR
jgi:hypothetical protein